MRTLLLALGLLGLFLGWNAPNHYPPWTTFHLESFAATGLCFIAVAVFFAAPLSRARDMPDPGMTRVALPWPAWAWVVVALLPCLQYASGMLFFRGDALIGLLYGLGVALAMYVGMLWAAQQDRTEVVRSLFLCILLGGLAANALALSQWLRLDAPGWWAMELIDGRPFASLGQPNHFGLLTVMSVVAVTALYEMRAIQERWVIALCVGFLGMGIVVSQSRASSLAVVTLACCWLLTRRRVSTRLRLADVLFAIAGGFFLAAAVPALEEVMLQNSGQARPSIEVGPRQWIWLHFWTAVMDRPWLGYGFNQAVLALASVAEDVQPSRNAIFAHNFVLDLMTWVGIPIALCLVAALIAWMTGWLRKPADPDLLAQRQLVFGLWLVLLVQSLLEYPYAHTYFLLPAALLAGAITDIPGPPKPTEKPVVFGPSRLVMVLAAGAVCLFAVLIWEYWRIEEDFRHSRFSRANFMNLPEHESLKKPLVLDQLAALNASAGVEIKPGMSTDELAAMGMLARRFHMIWIRLDYAKALALNARLQEAERELLTIRSISHPAQYEQIERHWRTWLRDQPSIAESD